MTISSKSLGYLAGSIAVKFLHSVSGHYLGMVTFVGFNSFTVASMSLRRSFLVFNQDRNLFGSETEQPQKSSNSSQMNTSLSLLGQEG